MSPVVRLIPVWTPAGLGSDSRVKGLKSDPGGAVGRVDLDPPVAATERDVRALLEPELVDVEVD